MKLSTWIFITDLLPEKKGIFDKLLVDQFIKKSLFGKDKEEKVFKALKEFGVDGIELLVSRNTTDGDLKKVSLLLKKNKTKVLSIHQPLELIFNISSTQIEKLFYAGKLLNAKLIVLHLKAISKNLNNKNFMNKLKKLERQSKIKIAIENDHKTPISFFVPYISDSNLFSAAVINYKLNVTFDTSHLAQAGGDIINFYNKNKKKIINIHLSDYKNSFLNKYLFLNKDMHMILGKGELQIKELLTALKKDKYNGYINLEIRGSLNDIVKSVKFVKKTL